MARRTRTLIEERVGRFSTLRGLAGSTAVADLKQAKRASLMLARPLTLDRWPEPGNRRHRRFETDVVRTRGAGLDAHAFAGGTVPPIDGGAMCDREIRLKSLEFPDRLSAIPGRQQIQHPGADRLGLEHAAIEQYGGGHEHLPAGPWSNQCVQLVARLHILQAAREEAGQ